MHHVNFHISPSSFPPWPGNFAGLYCFAERAGKRADSIAPAFAGTCGSVCSHACYRAKATESGDRTCSSSGTRRKIRGNCGLRDYRADRTVHR